MGTPSNIFHVKVDSSGRIVLPAEAREKYHISGGDTLVIETGESGFRMRTFDQALADVQAYFADLAPPDVLLSEEILQDRRVEHERD